MKWIKNVKDAKTVVVNGTTLKHGDSICVHCSKQMPECWDTVCFKCGGTSCYDHSKEFEGKWFCVKCSPKKS